MNALRIDLPDAISLSRVALAFLFLVTFHASPGVLLGLSIFIALLAQATDHLDGFLVRRLSEPTLTGWIFDSFSDRAFYVAAALSFEREYEISEIVVWLFVLRELALYAIRVFSGDFESVLPGFRKLALAHAALVRIAIAFGCAIPYIAQLSAHNRFQVWLTALLSAATMLGYVNLWLLLRKLP